MTRALFFSALANDHQLRSHKAQRLLWFKDLSTPGPGSRSRCLLAIPGTGESLESSQIIVEKDFDDCEKEANLANDLN